MPPEFEEELENDDFSYEVIENFALGKARSLVEKVGEEVVIIGADTVVVCDGKILGKPKDEEDALKMLKLLNGRTHKVVTSVCVIFKHKTTLQTRVKSTTTQVTFNELTDRQLRDYIEGYKPLDKAGAYGIQELPEYFVKEIKGDFDNVIGLPCKTLRELIVSSE